jgi:hypothetical protein
MGPLARFATQVRSSDAVARAELAFRAAATHGCKLGEAGRFWAIFGLMSSAERSSFTGRSGVRGRMQRPLRESEEAAAARHVDRRSPTSCPVYHHAASAAAPGPVQGRRSPRGHAGQRPPPPPQRVGHCRRGARVGGCLLRSSLQLRGG